MPSATEIYFWRLEVWDQGAGRVGFIRGHCLWLQMCPHMAFSLWMCPPGVSSSSYKNPSFLLTWITSLKGPSLNTVTLRFNIWTVEGPLLSETPGMVAECQDVPSPWCEDEGVYSLDCVCAKSLQLCLTLWDPMDCSLPGSSVHGILQARKLEWVAVPSPRGSSWGRDLNLCLFCHLHWQRVLYH